MECELELIQYLWAFVAGGICGGILGIGLMCMMFIAANADKHLGYK